MREVSQSIEYVKSLYADKQIEKLEEYFRQSLCGNLVSFNLFKYTSLLLSKCNLNVSKPYEFTVVTVNYNNHDGLMRTFESVNRQTVRDGIQFIVVDGNSTDGSLDFLRANCKNIDIAVYGQDKGVYDAMNRGIGLAEGQYTIFMNSGDIFVATDTLEQLKSVAKQSSFPDFIFGGALIDGKHLWKPLPKENLWKGMICSHQSSVFKTSKIKNIGYSLNNVVVSDYELIAKLLSSGSSFLATDITIANVEPVGISADFLTRTIERWRVVRTLEYLHQDPNIVDEFYTELLRSDGTTSPHAFKPREFHTEKGDIQSRVIFLISMPRSGSTLLQRIIEQCPEIGSTGEPWVMLPLLSMYDEELVEAKYGQEFNIGAKNSLETELGTSGIEKSAQKAYADQIYSDLLAKVGRKMFLDKTPRYVHVVAELIRLYPRAKFLVMTRDPVSVASSYATTWRGGNFKETYSDEHYHYDFDRGFEKLLDFINSDFKNKLVFSYEELVENPIQIARAIFDYLGLSFDPDWVNYGKKGNLKKYAFGDPNAVYKNDRPVANHGKWLEAINSKEDASYLTSILKLVSKNVYNGLGYDYDKTLQAIEKRVNPGFPSIAELNTRLALTSKFNSKVVRSSKKLGVLITCFNNEGTIIDSLNSIVNQTYKPDLIKVVDDCSSDSSVSLVEEFIGHHPDIPILLERRETNIGVSTNRDLGIRSFDADYITTLDGDDIYYPTKLQFEIAKLENRDDLVAFSDIIMLTSEGINKLDTGFYDKLAKDKALESMLARSAPVPRDMMFSKSLYIKSEGFDQGLNLYEDWALKMRLMGHASEEGWRYTGSPGTIYDRRNPGLSNKSNVRLAYGQLLAISRNIKLIANSGDALRKGLETVAGCFPGQNRNRIIQAAAGEVNRSVLCERLSQIWENRNIEYSDSELFTLFSSLTVPSKKKSDSEQNTTKIFICTPAFNSASTIDRTIESVINQKGNFELHYHVQDGGSNDGTVDILKRWKQTIDNRSYTEGSNKVFFTFTSEKDNGMYHAISKGFGRFSIAEKDWMSWINSDDFLAEDAFESLAAVDAKYSDVKWLTGKTRVVDVDGSIQTYFQPITSEVVRLGLCDGKHWGFIQQEGTFWKGEVWKRLPNDVLTKFRYAGDWNLWREIAQFYKLFVCTRALGNFCKRKGQISEANIDQYYDEIDSIISIKIRRDNLLNVVDQASEANVIEIDNNEAILKSERIEKYYNFRVSKVQ